MNVKTIADHFCERPAVPASSHSADRLAERWRLSDFFELTKPRVMVLAVFTAVAGLVNAPGQLDLLPALIAVLSIAAGAGAAGALPPVIGWVAATGEIGLEPLTLFLIIFLWTPPHFWALALNRSDDYARAGVPMLPVVVGRAATTRQILIYSGLLVLASELPWVLGFAGAVNDAIAAICGGL